MNRFTTNLFPLALVFLFAIQIGHAQEAVFAQYFASPQHTNPALTGVFAGDYRFNANYRRQWGGIFSDIPISTFHAGLDMKFNVKGGDFFALGINALSDETGTVSNLKTTRGYLSGSYLKQIGGSKYKAKRQYLVAGGQMGIGQQSMGYSGVWFDRQFDSVNATINTNLASGEVTPQSDIYPDFNAGLLFYSTWTDRKSFYMGLSMHHLSKPNISFQGNPQELLRQRFTVHGGAEIPLTNELSLLPSALLTVQGPAMWSMVSSKLRFTTRQWDDIAIRVGGSLRMSNRVVGSVLAGEKLQTQKGKIWWDAMTITGMIEMKSWLFGASYDLHASSIQIPTNYRGAWELSITHTGEIKKRVKTVCPRF